MTAHRTGTSSGPLGPGREPQWRSGSELKSCSPLFAAWFGDIKPLLLPLLDGVVEGTRRPNDLGHLAHHGTAALGVFATYHLGLHIENLQPQAEVGRNPEKGLAHDDERRDIEKRVGGETRACGQNGEGTRLSREAPE